MLKKRFRVNPWGKQFSELATKEDIAFCFRLILGRDPNKEEWPGHSSFSGSKLDEVVRSYLNSLEFKSRELISYDRDIIKYSTNFGFEIYLNMKDNLICKPISQGVIYEKHVTETFQNSLKSGMTLLDIGANVGWYSLFAANFLNDTCNIYAFEPFSENIKLLMASLVENNFDSIKVIQSAAGNELGIASFGASNGNGQCKQINREINSILKSETVNMIRIDDLIKEKVDLIKLDIEGGEYKALSGALSILKNSKPIIFSEFTPSALPSISGIQWHEYLNFIVKLGYEISVIEETTVKCHQDINNVYKIYQDKGTDHLDLIFSPIL